ncbi:MAG: aminopeptidase P family protein [Bacteroidales bacterium]|nr:aminopeptidase P family protein [Bacteroidales bacterium]
MFDREIYVERRRRLKNKLQSGKLLFIGNDEAGMNYVDNTYHYRQDSTFLYYFGISKPGLYALIDLDENKEYLFGENPVIDSIIWDGVKTTIEDYAQQVGVENTGSLSSLKTKIDSFSKESIKYLPPYRGEHFLKLRYLLGYSPAEAKQKVDNKFINAVANQRNIKSTEEIEELEKAVNVTVDMHLAAMRYAQAGMTEAQVTAKVHETALAAGGNISFPIIGTINGQFLHNHYHGNTIKDGDLFLLDAGFETERCYAGDMSSTFPVSGKFTERQKEVYRITLDAHNQAIEMLKPGVNFKDVHFKASEVIFDGLKGMGLTKGDTQEAVKSGAHAMFFPCGTGHLLGMDVHDMENLGEQIVGYNNVPKETQFGIKSLRLGRPLEPGFVVTIEPGIYFIPDLINHWKENKINNEFINFKEVEKYANFSGIRNEEDVLITETGYRILGKPLAKSIEDVEKEREQRLK